MKKDWIIRILKTLTKEEYGQVLRNAKMKGFKVDGFKDPTKVPLAKLIATINNSNKITKKPTDYVKCITEAIIMQCEYVLEKDEENKQASSRYKVARYVLHNGSKEDEALEKELEELEHSREQAKAMVTEADSNTKPDILPETYTKKIAEMERQMADLSDAADKAKAKINKHEEKIRLLNLETEDKDKLIKKLEKELQHAKDCEEREEEFLALQKEYKKLEMENSSLVEKIKGIEEELIESNEQLYQYQDENSRKVLFFTKKEVAADYFSGYRIQCAASFEISHQIPWENFDEIWALSKDFGYGTIREIERASQKTVHTFYSHKVITTI